MTGLLKPIITPFLPRLTINLYEVEAWAFISVLFLISIISDYDILKVDEVLVITESEMNAEC